MAEYDGSIRIGIKLQLADAEKQFQHLKDSMIQQTKEVDRQAQAVQKLKDDYNALIEKEEKSGKRAYSKETSRKISDLSDTLQEQNKSIAVQEAKLSRLEDRYKTLENQEKNGRRFAEIFSEGLKNTEIAAAAAYEELSRIDKIAEAEKKANYGVLSDETQERLNDARYRVVLLNSEAEKLRENLQRVNINPASPEQLQEASANIEKAREALDRMRQAAAGTQEKISSFEKQSLEAEKLAGKIQDAEQALKAAQESMASTEQEMNAASREVDRLNERFRQIHDSATVADKGVLKLREELEQLQQRKADLEAAGVGLGFREYDETVRRIDQVNNELTAYKNNLSKVKDGRSWLSKINNLVARLGKSITALGKNKGLEKTADSAGKLSRRLKTIITGALFFNVISRGLTALTKQIGAYLTANKDFSSALSGIQSNLLTAFQPIYESVLPALTAMMEAMETVTAKFAAFMATVFGTTAAKAQENAEALYEQANATEETGKAAKKAQKFLASFDTIEKLGSKETDKKENKAAPAFDTAFEGIQAPKWLLDFWKVFQDGWKQYGEPVMAAFKSAIGTIGDLIRAIGALFMSIWTGGSGLEFLGSIAGLLEVVLGIIHDIAAAFMAAWNNTYGQAVLEAMSYALNSVLALLVSIGAAFREAWNDGSGEQICATILSILTNIFNIVGNLANRLREAWEANGNGVAIWNIILDIVQDVLDFFNEITLATAQWTEGLDLEPIVSGFRAFLAAVEPLVDLLLGGLSWAWENILLPLAGWVIEDAAPAAVDFLSTALGTLVQILSALAPLFQLLWSVMKPVAEFMGGAFVKALNDLASVIQMVGDALTWLINLTTQIASVNAKTLFGIDIGGGGASKTRSAYAIPQSYAYDSAAVADAFPHLAGGAVIAPNHEFLAVLGDQKSGTNIETPLSTMKQAFLEAIAESGITRQSGGGGVAELTLDGQKFARLIFPYTQGERSRRGVNLVMGGA